MSPCLISGSGSLENQEHTGSGQSLCQQARPRSRTGPMMAANSFMKMSAANVCCLILIIATIHSSDLSSTTVRCQDFEDLNSRPAASGNVGGGGPSPQQPQGSAAFQPNRQFAQLPSTNNPQFQTTPNSRQSFQRPVLSNRFAQQLNAQASTVSNTVVSGQQQPQTLPTTSSSQQQSQVQNAAATSNIEQIMKNALNRASKLEQSAGNVAESRQDQNIEPVQSRSGAQFQSAPAQTAAQASSSTRERSVAAAPSETAETRSGQTAEDTDKITTTTQATTSAHETVYSDQRFANLFARRANQKKTKFTPTEQVKAKPTLPSFIKSPPDPKQFNANAAEGQDRPTAQASANLISARLQQQSNQNRQSVSQSQKKPVAAITSNTAASANNKRLNSQKQAASTAPKAGTTSRANGPQASPVTPNKPVSGNPFNKPQSNSNDPANVIAMARRRLLANSAVQQQQRPTNN